MVEGVVRSNGSVPASIGMISGRVHVGLTPLQLNQLAEPGMSKIKVSRRDFPYALSKVSRVDMCFCQTLLYVFLKVHIIECMHTPPLSDWVNVHVVAFLLV